jgi:hypothetical protein
VIVYHTTFTNSCSLRRIRTLNLAVAIHATDRHYVGKLSYLSSSFPRPLSSSMPRQSASGPGVFSTSPPDFPPPATLHAKYLLHIRLPIDYPYRDTSIKHVSRDLKVAYQTFPQSCLVTGLPDNKSQAQA